MNADINYSVLEQAEYISEKLHSQTERKQDCDLLFLASWLIIDQLELCKEKKNCQLLTVEWTSMYHPLLINHNSQKRTPTMIHFCPSNIILFLALAKMPSPFHVRRQ